MTNPREPADLYRAVFERWRDAVLGPGGQRSTAPWTRLVEQMFATQSLVSRMAETSLDAWSRLAPKVDAGEDWRAGLAEYGERMRRELLDSPTNAFRTARDIQDLWPSYLEHLQRLDLLGWDAPRERPVRTGDPAGFADTTALTRLFWDAWESTFGQLVQGPVLGPGREATDRVLRGFDAWVEWMRAAGEYQAIVADTWVRALERFVETAAGRAARAERPATARELTELYFEVAEGVFVEQFMSDKYIEAQARLTKAGAQYWAREEEIADGVLRLSHVPSRSEVDAAHRNVYELRKQVRELRRELRALRDEARRGAPEAEDPNPVERAATATEADEG